MIRWRIDQEFGLIEWIISYCTAIHMTRIDLSSSRSSYQQEGLMTDNSKFVIFSLLTRVILHQELQATREEGRGQCGKEERRQHGTVCHHRPLISKIMNSSSCFHHHRFLSRRTKAVFLEFSFCSKNS
jgi:hypothetical protein